jgi:peroxiredoxin
MGYDLDFDALFGPPLTLVLTYADLTGPPEPRMPSPSIDERLAEAFAHYRNLEAPLHERLAGYAVAADEIFPAYGKAVDQLVQRLQQTGGGANAPQVGDRLPDFLLPDDHGRLVALDALLAKGPTAVMFHRGHWCPYCRMNVGALVRARLEIAAKGGQVVIITPENQQYAQLFKLQTAAPFPVLTDVDNGYALSLNLAIWLGPDLRDLLSERGRVLSDYHGNDAWMLPIPASFVVATDGRITARFVDPDFRRRMDIDELITALANSD